MAGSRLTPPIRVAYPRSALRPSAYFAETYPRVGAPFASQGVLTSGRATLFAIYLYTGEVVTNISVCSGLVAASAVNNIWFALAKSDGTRVGISADDSGNGWAASTVKTLALAAPYTVAADGVHYIAVMVNATVPNLFGVTLVSVIHGLTPTLCARDDAHTGLTNPASAPATFTLSTNMTGQIWGAVS